MRTGVVIAALSSAALIAAGCSSLDDTAAAPEASAAITPLTSVVTIDRTPTTEPAEFPPPTYLTVAGDYGPDPFPAGVDGYVAEGDVERTEVRVFGNGIASTVWDGGAAGSCYKMFWIARWWNTSDLPILATTGNPSSPAAYVGDIYADPVLSDLDDLGPPVGTKGYLTGYGCEVPVFGRPPSFVGPTNVITDLVVEVQRYTPGVDVSDEPVPEFVPGPPTKPSAPVTCEMYETWLDLPFLPCSTGLIVGRIQDRLVALGYDGVTVDYEYGPSTMAAVVELQIGNGLIPDGIVGARTWSLLMDDAWYPSSDLDGNGRLSPDELIFD
jgi:hypothetical protein